MKKSNRRSRITFFAIVLTFSFLSCEKVIDISIPDKERKIVINGLISATQPVRVMMSRSLSVLEKDSLIPIGGGVIKLFKGDEMIGQFQEGAGGSYTLPGFVAEVGQAYRLTASSDPLKPVEATATLPPMVPFLSVDTATVTGEWSEQLMLTIKFKDPESVRNLYGFGVNVTYKEFNYMTMQYTGRRLSHPVYLYSNDDDRFLKDESTNFEGKLYFDDLLFDGQTKTVQFGVSDYSFFESDTVWLDVSMEQIDPSYYLYVLSFSAYQQANGNPFSEPVQVYSNVKDGYGIFAGSSAATFSILTSGKGKFR